jgi:hypothetical protein
MNQELQIGKHEFIPYKFDDEYEKLLKELELLSLNEKERGERRRKILKRLKDFRRNQDVSSADYQALQRERSNLTELVKNYV